MIGGPAFDHKRGVPPVLWVVVLGVVIALAVGMVVLVVAEVLVPIGSVRGPAYLARGMRLRMGRARLARSVRLALEHGGVTFAKLGQVLSTCRDLVPAEFVSELSRLQDGAAPVAWSGLEQGWPKAISGGNAKGS